jgi:hypothetical protein
MERESKFCVASKLSCRRRVLHLKIHLKISITRLSPSKRRIKPFSFSTRTRSIKTSGLPLDISHPPKLHPTSSEKYSNSTRRFTFRIPSRCMTPAPKADFCVTCAKLKALETAPGSWRRGRFSTSRNVRPPPFPSGRDTAAENR